jgi:glutamyl-tRNA reductase
MTERHFFFLGATHRTAPLEMRERLALGATTEAALAQDFSALSGLSEFLILNTCNRIEIYGVAASAETVEHVEEAFCSRQGFARDAFAGVRLYLRGHDAICHLLKVACGLDSQVLGETEIFGQIKKAYGVAQARGSAGPVLNRVFQKTFQAAKDVRTKTAITSGLVSVANVSVDLAVKVFGRLSSARILLLGAGEIGAKSGRAFKSRGAASLTVASRRLDRAMEVAKELDAEAISLDECAERLEQFDVVVCSTSAPGIVITPEAVRSTMKRRAGRPQFFIDLALPRDVDPAVASLENVFLYNLDDLAKIAGENRAVREAEVAKCHALLAERADALWVKLEPMLGDRVHPLAPEQEHARWETPATFRLAVA